MSAVRWRILGGGVDQQQLAVTQRLVVLDVVQDAGVVAAGHDRAVAHPLRTHDAEDVLERGLDLPFGAAGRREAHGLGVCDGADATGLTQGVRPPPTT